MMAESLLYEMVPWACVALFMNILLVALITRFDTNYYEHAIAISQKVESIKANARKGHANPFQSKKSERNTSIPMFPNLNGIGPIMWRQFTSAYRNAKILFIMVPVFCIMIGPIMFVQKADSEIISPIIFILIWFSIFFGQMMPFDFRGDLDRMDWLKNFTLKAYLYYNRPNHGSSVIVYHYRNFDIYWIRSVFPQCLDYSSCGNRFFDTV
jgi:uncharacterized protein YheU (UPF0270 family)